MTFTVSKSFGNILALNTDIRLDVVIKDLCIDEPDFEGRYYVDAVPDYVGWQQSWGVWLETMLGPYCSNSHILVPEAFRAEHLRFDTILKPLTDGEVLVGAKAALKVRLEMKDLQTVEDGEVKAIRYQLVACDPVVEQTPEVNKLENLVIPQEYEF